MKTKNVVIGILILSIFVITGCSTIKSVFGKSSKAEAKQQDKITTVEKKQNQNLQDLMNQVAIFASGTDYALDKTTNKEPIVVVAQDINKRVISMSGKPNINAEKEMWKTVDQLTSDLVKEKEKGKLSLDKKDKEISNLQTTTDELNNEFTKEIDKYKKISEANAGKVDSLNRQLDKYKGWFGLSAVWMGIKQLISTGMWFLIGGCAIFLVLRIFAASNPIAGAIFSIFNVIGCYFIKGLNYIVPRAVEFSGNIATSAYTTSQTLLTKIVDSVQYIKNIEKTTNKDITVKELLVELDKTMDKSEKDIIDKLKKDLGY